MDHKYLHRNHQCFINVAYMSNCCLFSEQAFLRQQWWITNVICVFSTGEETCLIVSEIHWFHYLEFPFVENSCWKSRNRTISFFKKFFLVFWIRSILRSCEPGLGSKVTNGFSLHFCGKKTSHKNILVPTFSSRLQGILARLRTWVQGFVFLFLLWMYVRRLCSTKSCYKFYLLQNWSTNMHRSKISIWWYTCGMYLWWVFDFRTESVPGTWKSTASSFVKADLLVIFKRWNVSFLPVFFSKRIVTPDCSSSSKVSTTLETSRLDDDFLDLLAISILGVKILFRAANILSWILCSTVLT